MARYRIALTLLGMALFAVCVAWPREAGAQVDVTVGGVRVHVGDSPPPPPVIEVLTRGPVHEAFAQPVTFDEEAAYIITRRPPAAIEEMPPDQRPAGNHIDWIPGYWAWDSDRNDFIWVSGCWRAVPPNTSWVPGYWAQVRGGYQWIAGFWTAVDTTEIEYLPAPPETLEAGPRGNPATPDSVWIPGCWVRYEGRYAWRPGSWVAAQANWVWVPAHYVATPRGWVYVAGYWDYPLDRRGVAFLPMYAPASLYGRADFRYSPDITLDLGGLELNLFLSPQRHHYYFGDYYGAEYAREDFHPWYEARDHYDWYDPIYVHDQWTHRDDRRWADNQRTEYEHRRDNTAIRPARTYEALRAQVARLPEKDRRQVQVARPMAEVVAAKTTPFKYDTLDAKTREATVTHAKDVHAYQDKRAQWESPSVTPTAGPGPKAAATPNAVAAPKETVAPREVVTPKAPVSAPPKETVTPREVVTPKAPVSAPPRETVTPREVVAPKAPVDATPREVPKEPVKVTATPAPARTVDHAVVVNEKPAAQDITPHKVAIPKSPVVARETPKELTPPPKPAHPSPDLTVQPKSVKSDGPDRSKDNERSDKDKDKPDSPKK